MQSKPQLLAWITCDGVHIDPSTGKHTILGAFSNIQAKHFPATHPHMVWFMTLTDCAVGEHQVQISLGQDPTAMQPLIQRGFESPSPLQRINLIPSPANTQSSSKSTKNRCSPPASTSSTRRAHPLSIFRTPFLTKPMSTASAQNNDSSSTSSSRDTTCASVCDREHTQNNKAVCDCIGVGSPIMDLLAHVDDDFLRDHVAGEKGGMVLVDDADIAALVGKLETVVKVSGGAAANTTLAAAQLGLSTAFLGKVGADTTASDYLANFCEHAVDTARFKQHATLPNARCLSFVTPDGQRTMRTHLGAAMTLAPEEISAADFADVRHAHIEGYLLFNPALADAVLTAARAAGCTISLDLASFEVVEAARDWIFAQLEQGIDIVFANEDETRTLFANDAANENYEDLARAIARFGGIAAVKIGADGAWVAHGDALHRVAPAPVTQVVDTTGAGDAWAGGFLYAHLRGAPLATAGALGSRLGAEAVQCLGAAIPADRWPEIRTKADQLLAPHTA